MSIEIKKDITIVQVEIPKTNVAVENAVTQINVQTSQPLLTISQAGVSGRDGTSGTSGISSDGFPFSGSAEITGSLLVTGSIFLNGTDITSIVGNGVNGSSGTSGVGTNGTSGTSGIDGTSGVSGTSGTSGENGSSGTSGFSINSGSFITTSSFNNFTSSFNTISASFDLRISQATNEQDLSYLATTGSNTFVGEQTISGSQYISGSIILTNGAIIKDNKNSSIAFGKQAAEFNQGTQSVAIGQGAGNYDQNNGAVAVGANAGGFNQGLRATAIGSLAGGINQGEYAVALGNWAGGTDQAQNSIIINATGTALNNTTTSSLKIAPIRNITGSGVLQYNDITNEVSYGDIISASITFVGNQIVSGSINLTGDIIRRGSPGLTLSSSHNAYIVTDAGDNNRTWTFDGTGGDTIFPNGAQIGDDGDEVGNTELRIPAVGGGYKTWTFGSDGILKLNNSLAEIYADADTGFIRIADTPQNIAPHSEIIIGGQSDVFKVKYGPPLREWVFVGNGDFNLTGSINGARNLATTGSNIFVGDQTITGSLNISGSGSLNGNNIVSSNTVLKIETISSASYSTLNPPVSGTLYIII